MKMNRGEVAAAMGVSLPTLDKWVKDGCPIEVRGRKGVAAQFVLADVIAWWGARERSIAAGDGPADEEQLKKRKLSAEAGLAELEFAQKRGEVAPIREFERAQAKMMAAIRANVMNIPSRAVLQLLGEKDEGTFKRILRAECALALEQSAQADFELGDDADDDEAEDAE